ncbi:MAG: glycerophosphodiester phosphodiesterase [Solirubrobacteraceae bacterium]
MPTTVIAHRGASAHALEHTTAAFDLAIAQGADVLELDLRSTLDNTTVVVHDETLLRTAGDDRAVAALGWAEIEAVPGGGRPLRLEDVFARYGRTIRYLLDLKDPSPAIVGDVVRLVDRFGLADRVAVQSFETAPLRYLRQLRPAVPVALLYPFLMPARLIRADLPRVADLVAAIGPHAASVDGALVADAHRLGIRVQAWTVNDRVDMGRLLRLGVDALITDAPDRARDVLASVAAAA